MVTSIFHYNGSCLVLTCRVTAVFVQPYGQSASGSLQLSCCSSRKLAIAAPQAFTTNQQAGLRRGRRLSSARSAGSRRDEITQKSKPCGGQRVPVSGFVAAPVGQDSWFRGSSEAGFEADEGPSWTLEKRERGHTCCSDL